MTKEERTDQLKMRGLFAFAAVMMAVLVILKILEPEDKYECCDADNRIIIVQRSEIEIKEDGKTEKLTAKIENNKIILKVNFTSYQGKIEVIE